MRVFVFGRVSIGFFPYWIGINRRYVKGLGQVRDLGYIKVVW